MLGMNWQRPRKTLNSHPARSGGSHPIGRHRATVSFLTRFIHKGACPRYAHAQLQQLSHGQSLKKALSRWRAQRQRYTMLI